MPKVALISASVMVVAGDVATRVAQKPQEENPGCALLMVVEKDVKWKTVQRAQKASRDSASPTEVENDANS